MKNLGIISLISTMTLVIVGSVYFNINQTRNVFDSKEEIEKLKKEINDLKNQKSTYDKWDYDKWAIVVKVEKVGDLYKYDYFYKENKNSFFSKKDYLQIGDRIVINKFYNEVFKVSTYIK